MTWKRNVLVVANVTATSAELLEALRSRARDGACSFTLVVPATPFGGGRRAAEAQLAEAIGQWHAAGLEADGRVGAPDPIVAVTDLWDPMGYDEIVVSTLPMTLSKWLHAGLPERIAKLTDASVTHVVAQPPKPEVETVAARHPESGVLGPLSVLAWGGQKER
jgi:GABA permease